MQGGRQAAENSLSGDSELAQVARKCLDSPKRHLFVVGPPRSGKSTRLPIILAALSGKKVISVQPDNRAARYHAEWIQGSIAASVSYGIRLRVGYYSDDTDMSTEFVPDYAVSFVSYKWLCRMVASINSKALNTGLDNEYTRSKAAKEDEALKEKRKQYGDLIGCIVLDELHAQSVAQELGYLAIHAATSGLAQPPVGISEKTKLIVTTAYPENNTFMKRFALSAEQIRQQTISISTGLAPSASHVMIQELFIAEDDQTPSDYHTRACRRARAILENDRDARVLLFMDTTCSSRNIARSGQAVFPQHIEVIDLEDDFYLSRMHSYQSGQMVILATPSFASRIPIEGITDVICPPTQLLPALHKKIHREVLAISDLTRWELAWAKNHLDSRCKIPTIHYMFRNSLYSKLSEFSGARFRAGDFIDILLGAIRLCPQYALGAQTPVRFKIPLQTAEEALYQLTLIPETVSPAPSKTKSPAPYYQISPTNRTESMLKLMDRSGLDRKQAFFLGHLDQQMADCELGATYQRFVSIVGVCMVVFAEVPILTRIYAPSSGGRAAEWFRSHGDLLYLGEYRDFTCDSWVNAVVWMNIKQQADATNVAICKISLAKYNSLETAVDEVAVQAAEPKLRFLARMIGLNEESQDELCNGSFLSEVEKFNCAKNKRYQEAIEVLWDSYLDAYRFNLAYVQIEKDSVKITDISSGLRMDYQWENLAIDLFGQARIAEKNGRDGFYVTASSLIDLRLRNLTVMPLGIVRKITEKDNDGYPGAWDLHTHLKLGGE
ncbi:hypothetical protein F5Y07DRAFT_409253 [Xylaria sp. FL0933]|nr:hypothetical protein F5Y07DRAFT_409253 [Xylaria sp. FL0933]